MKPYIPDTSVIIEKFVSKLIKEKKIGKEILIPHAAIAELEAQANKGQETGLLGLEELQDLQDLAKKDIIKIRFVGNRPSHMQIRYAKSGEIDALIREIAFNEEAILITADRVQAESAKAFGIETIFIKTEPLKEALEIETLFDDKTMSVHLKENCKPLAKRGVPGNWQLEEIRKEIFDSQRIQKIAKEIVEKSQMLS